MPLGPRRIPLEIHLTKGTRGPGVEGTLKCRRETSRRQVSRIGTRLRLMGNLRCRSVPLNANKPTEDHSTVRNSCWAQGWVGEVEVSHVSRLEERWSPHTTAKVLRVHPGDKRLVQYRVVRRCQLCKKLRATLPSTAAKLLPSRPVVVCVLQTAPGVALRLRLTHPRNDHIACPRTIRHVQLISRPRIILR